MCAYTFNSLSPIPRSIYGLQGIVNCSCNTNLHESILNLDVIKTEKEEGLKENCIEKNLG